MPVNIKTALMQQRVRIVLPGSTGLPQGYKLRLAVVLVARDTIVWLAPRRLPLQVVLLAPTLLRAVVSLAIVFRAPPADTMMT
jgi:hypothetical protein